jgi:hypothetical protein
MTEARGYGDTEAFAPADAGPHAPFPPAAYASTQTSTSAIVALVLAVVSFVAFPLVPAIVALILARNAEEEILASAGRVTGQGLVRAARVTAWANLVTCAVVVVAVLGVLLVVSFLL